MEIINPNKRYDFVSKMGGAFKLSLILILISVGSLIYHGGPNWGVEFTGGTEIHLKFDKEITANKIGDELASSGYKTQSVQQFGLAGDNEFLVRFSPDIVPFEKIDEFKESLDKVINEIPAFEGASILRIDYIGPEVGKELVSKAVMAILFGCVGILLYIIFRFEFGFAMGAVLALVHDTIITLGAISLTNKDFTLAVVAALLTVIGYSVNDTIVIFDRIRENLVRSASSMFNGIVNEGVNQTLSRTILTGVTVFIVLIPLFFLGGSVIHDFAFTLIVGVLVGTYSSIFVASGFLVWWKGRQGKEITDA